MTDRAEAAHVVDVVAERLADPGTVAGVAAGNTIELDTGRRTVWAPASLTDGHPAVALLFAELAADDVRFRAPAHAHLAAAGVGKGRGLFDGPAALAFAGHAAGCVHGGYARLLATLDPAVAADARARRDRLAHGEPVANWATYDVTGGATGIARYLLLRSGPGLSEALDTLTTIATGPESRWFTDGHLNLGLAHGVAGPLALLAIAAEAGTPGLDKAAACLVELLCRWRHDDEAGPFWPRRAVDIEAPATRERDAWCHGAAGIGRALHLAGRSFDRPKWTDLAHAALRSALRPRGPYDSALCHGRAGLLQITLRMAMDTNDPHYVTAADALAAQLLADFDETAPFGYRFPHPRSDRPLDRPGFLDGAAGVALALHTYATNRPPRTPWDAALLLA